MVTMKKIAELCGVSRGTVDRALNGRGRVNAETAAMIKKMAEQLATSRILRARRWRRARITPSSAFCCRRRAMPSSTMSFMAWTARHLRMPSTA